MLREERCFAAELLMERGLRLDAVREELVRQPQPEGGGFGITSSRRVAPRVVELINDNDNALIARVPYLVLNMPMSGDEIVIGETKLRVVRLVHHFGQDAEERQLVNPDKIEIRVVPLAS